MNHEACRDTQQERRADIADRLSAAAQLAKHAESWVEVEPFIDSLLTSVTDRYERLKADEFANEYRSLVDGWRGEAGE